MKEKLQEENRKQHKKEEKEESQKKRDSELEKTETSDEDSAKSHGEILKQQINEGLQTFKKTSMSIWLSSFTAGLEIGFSFLLICTLHSFLLGKVSEETIFKLMAIVYPVGFIMVLGGQSILFTEQTSLLTLPVLNKKASARTLFKTWGIVIFGNLIGGCLMALLLIWIGPKLGIFELNSVETIAEHVTKYKFEVILVSAILAGWLMGLLSWLVAASKESISRIFIVYLITGVLAFAGLHHSIVGNVEVFAGLVSSPNIHLQDYLVFQATALIGNALGGTIFVALLKYRAFVYNAT